MSLSRAAGADLPATISDEIVPNGLLTTLARLAQSVGWLALARAQRIYAHHTSGG
jgi:hypothetical protein